MALRPIEIVSDGLLASGNSLSIAVRGLLRRPAIVVVVEAFQGFIANIGRLGKR